MDHKQNQSNNGKEGNNGKGNGKRNGNDIGNKDNSINLGYMFEAQDNNQENSIYKNFYGEDSSLVNNWSISGIPKGGSGRNFFTNFDIGNNNGKNGNNKANGNKLGLIIDGKSS